MKRMIMLRGADDIIKKLQRDAKMESVKRVVKTHTIELNRAVQQRAPVRTGFLRRSVIMSLEDDGMSGHVTATAIYANDVNFGTRYQHAQPFVSASYNIQKIKFQQDLKRLF